jgi:D-alanyl-D-alanine carboxypeptidase (penicillin-binding protein 5/6)
MILPSGAEASVSLAILAAGDEEAFVDRMNEKAKEMGLKNTHFTNCSGLHDADHYSTCTEMAMILAYALQYPVCREILSTYQYTRSATEKHPEGVELTSTMFSRVHGDEPSGAVIVAGKTGYTHQARHCLASYGEREADGAGFIFVTTNAEGKFEPIFDAIHVYSEYIHK